MILMETVQEHLLMRTSDRLEQGGHGSVRFGYGSCMERFERFRFSVLTVPLGRGFLGTSAAF